MNVLKFYNIIKQAVQNERVPVEPEDLLPLIQDGQIIALGSIKHENVKPLLIGKGLRVKVNANLETSEDLIDIEFENLKRKKLMYQ